MNFIIYFHKIMDDILMPFYRFPDNPLLGYYLGTLVLSFASVVMGEYSISLAFLFNKERITRDNDKMVHFQDLSVEALKAGDKTAYKACNSIANDTFGRTFFSQIALSAASLWPIFIALGWMQYRFGGVKFSLPFSIPGAGNTIGYAATFILCYISARILFGKIKYKLPYFKKINEVASVENEYS